MIGKRLIELRNQKKLTQKAVADKLKISRSTYSNYESNFREPDFKNAELLADIFEVSVDYLLGREERIVITDEKAEANRLRAEKFSKLSPERQEQILELMRDWIKEDK